MKKLAISMLGVLFLASSLAGCGTKEVQAIPVQAGVDKCDVCNMMVPDDHNATEIILKDGKVLKFDDIGDMFVWIKKNGTDQVQAQFVRDYHSKEWLTLESASFVHAKDFKTPMAYGVYSFKDSKVAQTFIDRQKKGKLLSAQDLSTFNWERNMDMMKEMNMNKQQDGMQH